jgi:glutamate synthase (NADPH/NADH) large chain
MLGRRLKAFGYTRETLQFMLLPMLREQRDPIGSMGNDAALAVLSDQPRLLYDYFKQLFAQVTNPPIDPIREEVVMSLECFIGPEQNLFAATAEHCHRLRLPQPLLSNQQLATLAGLYHQGWSTCRIDCTWPTVEGEAGLLRSLQRICQAADEAVAQGCALLLLSDRAVSPERVAIPSLLATGAIHQHLIRRANRTRVGLVIESGEAREVHHFSLLIGYGADAINPKQSGMPATRGCCPGNRATTSLSRPTSRLRARGCSRCFPKWGSPPCNLTKARRFLRPWGWLMK